MQGIYISNARAKTKSALKKADPSTLELEATSMFGNEYGGPVVDAPDGTYYVVGPDPYTSRKWYAQVIVRAGKVVVK